MLLNTNEKSARLFNMNFIAEETDKMSALSVSDFVRKNLVLNDELRQLFSVKCI